MFGAPRSLSTGATLAFAAMLVVGAGHEARAQIFDFAVKDSNAGGALGSAVARIGDIDNDGCEDFAVGERTSPMAASPGRDSCASRAEDRGRDQESDRDSGLELRRGSRRTDRPRRRRILRRADRRAARPHVGLARRMYWAYSPHRDLYLSTGSGGQGALFGSSVRSLEGDVDNDGVDDLIVGAPGIDTVYVYSGGTGYPLLSNSGQSGAGFGTAVCRGGDLDHDGTVDYLVGSPDYVDSGGTKTGRVSASPARPGTRSGRSTAQPTPGSAGRSRSRATSTATGRATSSSVRRNTSIRAATRPVA